MPSSSGSQAHVPDLQFCSLLMALAWTELKIRLVFFISLTTQKTIWSAWSGLSQFICNHFDVSLNDQWALVQSRQRYQTHQDSLPLCLFNWSAFIHRFTRREDNMPRMIPCDRASLGLARAWQKGSVSVQFYNTFRRLFPLGIWLGVRLIPRCGVSA